MKMCFLRISAAAVSGLFVTPAMAQDAATVLRASLPRDLSPWGMFLTANDVVQAVMIGLVLASVITWTVGLAKAIELIMLKRRLRGALTLLDTARSSVQAEQALGAKSPAAELVRAAIAEEALSADGSAEGLKERVASRLERIEAAAGRKMSRHWRPRNDRRHRAIHWPLWYGMGHHGQLCRHLKGADH
jgi:biopolymer transport protein ExbB